jgi:peptidoglycan/LPS O-acetylase OafA/YrhL
VDIVAKPVRLSPRSRHLVNVARAAAAIYVVLHHVALIRGFPAPFSVFKHFGHQAVICFFLLSGFVIHANERHRVLLEPNRYILRRILRIYPALLVAMLISTLVVSDVEPTWAEALGNLVALQDVSGAAPGTRVGSFMGNIPLWSLSYELWFYLLYPFIMVIWTRSPHHTNLCLALLCPAVYALYIASPNHCFLMTSYFAIWWVGAMAAEAYDTGARTPRAILIPLAGLAATVFVASLPILWTTGSREVFPRLQVNHLLSALLLALFGLAPPGALAARLARLVPVGLAAGLASISYGLYVFHWPLLLQWPVATSGIGFAMAVILLLVVSWLVDRELARRLSWLSRSRTSSEAR